MIPDNLYVAKGHKKTGSHIYHSVEKERTSSSRLFDESYIDDRREIFDNYLPLPLDNSITEKLVMIGQEEYSKIPDNLEDILLKNARERYRKHSDMIEKYNMAKMELMSSAEDRYFSNQSEPVHSNFEF